VSDPAGPQLDTLQGVFAENFGSRGSYLIRAPGRVNLMGEHIDYNGLAVLPMAIQRHVALLSAPRTDGIIRVVNTATEFPQRGFELSAKIAPYDEGDWGNYVKAAAQALAGRHGARHGFDAVVSADIPIAAGLSSSSALVVAAALALVTANDIAVPLTELMELLADAEWYVGTQGGGMDQAVCLGAKAQCAAKVEFKPLRLRARPIPPGWRFVVASSLVRAEKSGPARETYNRRTAECREALTMVLQRHGLVGPMNSYRILLGAVGAELLMREADEMEDPVLGKRFRHVASEGRRVIEAENALRAGDLEAFGYLMLASHASLRDEYEVSIPELDELVEIAVAAGAAGARLTGAGLGGCIVALCDEARLEGVLQALEDGYYGSQYFDEPLTDHLFVAEPSAGASVSTL
jgi:galactokinase